MIVACLSVCSASGWAAGCSDEQLLVRMEYATDAIARFFELCADSSTQRIDFNRVVEDSAGRKINCRSEYKRVMKLKADIEALKSGKESCVDSAGSCSYASRIRQRWRNPQENPMECWGGMGAALLPPIYLGQTPPDNNCYMEFIFGIVKDVVYNAEGLGALAQYAGSAAAKAVVPQNSAKPAEPKRELVDQFRKNPFEFVEQTSLALWLSLENAIKNDFGCRKWSGGYSHMGRCLEPLSGWDQATCAQRLQAVCGIIGYSGGELASAFLLGGAAGYSIKLATLAGAKSMQIERVSVALSKMEQAGAKVSLRTLSLVKTTWDAFVNSRAVRALDAARAEFNRVVTSFEAAQTLIKVGGKTFSPVGSYLKLMDEAASCGFQKFASPQSYRLRDNVPPEIQEH